MNIGMLWYDDSPVALKERIERAVEYYLAKYGRKPNLCLVHPSMLNGEELRMNGLVVRRLASVRPGHFWIGVEDEPAEKRRSPRPASRRGPARAGRSSGPKRSKPAGGKAAKPAGTDAARRGQTKSRPAARKSGSARKKKPAGRRK